VGSASRPSVNTSLVVIVCLVAIIVIVVIVVVAFREPRACSTAATAFDRNRDGIT
jgi:hypothetical protein